MAVRSIEVGDYVIIQFGHNDVGPLDEKGKFRGSGCQRHPIDDCLCIWIPPWSSEATECWH